MTRLVPNQQQETKTSKQIWIKHAEGARCEVIPLP